MSHKKDFHVITLSKIVKPVDACVFDESAVVVELEDEGAGCFVTVFQDGKKIGITSEEWPFLRDAIEEMLSICEDQEQAENLAKAEGRA